MNQYTSGALKKQPYTYEVHLGPYAQTKLVLV